MNEWDVVISKSLDESDEEEDDFDSFVDWADAVN